MVKDLLEMSLEELWNLFPVFLVAPSERWKQNYQELERDLNNILSGYPVKRISHIGSTAILGIWAKNIVDVLVEIFKDCNIERVAAELQKNGFICMSRNLNRISLNFGYTKNGFADKVYHVHLRYYGDNDELYFRDYLNENPKVAKEYENLKLKLWKKFEYNRDEYTKAKTDFVKRWTAVAKRDYHERY